MRTLALLLLFTALCAAQPARAQADSAVFQDLLFDALQGDMHKVVTRLNTLDDAALSPDQMHKKHLLIRRFDGFDEDFVFPTRDSTLMNIMAIYLRYWGEVLLEGDTKEHEAGLAYRISEHLRTHVSALAKHKEGWTSKKWNELLDAHLKSLGCYAAIGKTGPFYDLLLHMQETEVRYPVTTPEDTLDVKVIFMDSVICNGWEGYATADTYFPGGWATNDALYCHHSSYDLASEQFSISYLKHEGKHFADYKRFPKLQSNDLEYRAKLVELGAATTTLYDLIRFFLGNNVYDANNAHAYANFCVMRDMSRVLFHSEQEADLEAWKRLPVETVQRTATELLKKNSRDLENAGARRVTAFIR
ncbi:MAG: hypothetical protein ABI599_10175 [Flavobacteriales bacterium]